jgi:beta-lactamase class C
MNLNKLLARKYKFREVLGKTSLFFSLFITLPFFSIGGIEINKPQDPIAKFNLYAKEAIEHWNLPGIAYAIVSDGKIIDIECHGYKDVKRKEKIDKNTIFRIASISKSFTAVLASKLQEKKYITFNDKINKFLPHIKFSNDHYASLLKISDLLKHTTGFAPRAFSKLIEDEQITYNDIHKQVEKTNFTHKPGVNFNYQNYMFNLVADIMQNSTGKSFQEILEEEIIIPLKLENTSSGVDSFLNNQNKALPHSLAGPRNFILSINDIKSPYYKVPAAGGINSSIKDMAKWLQVIMGYHPNFIDKKSIESLQKPLVATPGFLEDTSWSSLESSYYGYGFRVHQFFGGEKVIHHGGALNGFRSSIVFIPSKKIGIVILSNANSPIPGLLTANFIDLMLGFEFKNYSKQYFKKYFDS